MSCYYCGGIGCPFCPDREPKTDPAPPPKVIKPSVESVKKASATFVPKSKRLYGWTSKKFRQIGYRPVVYSRPDGRLVEIDWVSDDPNNPNNPYNSYNPCIKFDDAEYVCEVVAYVARTMKEAEERLASSALKQVYPTDTAINFPIPQR